MTEDYLLLVLYLCWKSLALKRDKLLSGSTLRTPVWCFRPFFFLYWKQCWRVWGGLGGGGWWWHKQGELWLSEGLITQVSWQPGCGCWFHTPIFSCNSGVYVCVYGDGLSSFILLTPQCSQVLVFSLIYLDLTFILHHYFNSAISHKLLTVNSGWCVGPLVSAVASGFDSTSIINYAVWVLQELCWRVDSNVWLLLRMWFVLLFLSIVWYKEVALLFILWAKSSEHLPCNTMQLERAVP